MKATEKQLKIMRVLSVNGSPMTKQELIKETGISYYANTDKHFGDILSRMVSRGFIHRPKRGVYGFGPGGKVKPVDKDQLGLFD